MRISYKVVMLPTEKASKITLGDNLRGTHFELYILSDDEIKSGEDYVCDGKYIVKSPAAKSWSVSKKVIASTDKSITSNSWIPDSFVEAYVKSYKSGTPITEVSLEMIEEHPELNNALASPETVWKEDVLKEQENDYPKLKTRSDGSVIIHQSKMYSRDEVIRIIERYYQSGLFIDKEECNKWIEENL
jgi:hypothetical protein